MVDKYSRVDIGSSYLPSEVVAAFPYAQLEESERISEKRLALWHHYHALLEPLGQAEALRRPVWTAETQGHNAHMYHVLLPDQETRPALIQGLKREGIMSVFHYVALHFSPMGERTAGRSFDLPVTDSVANRLLRLSCYFELSFDEVERIVGAISGIISQRRC
jgi:dTDP-4-amino-4,6-dideoxygalactose transaminase